MISSARVNAPKGLVMMIEGAPLPRGAMNVVGAVNLVFVGLPDTDEDEDEEYETERAKMLPPWQSYVSRKCVGVRRPKR